MSAYQERKAQRTAEFNAKQGVKGVKTGSLAEIADVKRFYQTESDSAQARIEQEKAEVDSMNLVGEVFKYYDNDLF
jgi:hypothetical protein